MTTPPDSRPASARRWRRWLTLLGLLYWLGMTGWLVAESFPDLFERSVSGYRAVFSGGLMVMDRWMTITFQGVPIGYSHTAVDVNEGNPLAQYSMDSRTILTLNLMGQRQRVNVSVKADLDSFYALHRFTFILSSQAYSVSISGQRKEEDLFIVKVHTAGHVETTQVRIPDDAVLYSPMTDTVLKALRPGHQTRMKTFNPISMSTDTILVKALRTETIENQGKRVPATVMSMDYMGMQVLSWVGRDGQILRQETPYGWTMEASSPDQALARPSKVGNDLLTAMAVPVVGTLDRAAPPARVRYRLRGISPDRYTLDSQRQSLLAVTNETAELDVRADALPGRACSLADAARGHADLLAPSQGIEAADPRLIKRARQIVGGRTNSLDAALAIYDWVNRNVVKTPTVSLPSAVDVLQQLEGDCNEHTYLFVGLARAAGLPAKIRVGLMYNEGFFYYHAWPAVFVGRWLDMDPTLGQPAVDALHISLLEGELPSQLNLLPLLGRLRVEVEGARDGAAPPQEAPSHDRG